MNNKMATNNDAGMGALAHEQNWRVKFDWPTFARVLFLVISELTIATLFAQVFIYEASDGML
jgi:hypothetical protein